MDLRQRFLHDRFNPTGLPPEFATRARLGDPTLLVVTTLDPNALNYAWRTDHTQTQGCWWLCELLEPLEALPDPFSETCDTHHYWVQALCPILPSQLSHVGQGRSEDTVLLPWLNTTRTRGVLDWSQPLPLGRAKVVSTRELQ